MLPTLNLDDLTYQQLLEILRSHLPGEQWSDHNPSDPGITLLELLAWLGEMDLYRMNRVPAAHQDKFLKLLVDPPVPVTVKASLALDASQVTADVVVPPGLRLASDYRAGRRTVLESFTRVRVPRPVTGDETSDVVVRAVRDLVEVPLGTSDGRAHQIFAIPDGPVLLDFGSRVPGYDPNPRVRVGAVEWELRPFLLTPESQASPVAPPHFMVEDFEGQVRFGDDTFGAIPPAGAAITLIRCQILEGPAALVAEDEVKHVLNPELAGLAPGVLQIAASTDAQGGDGFFSAAERTRRGLEEFRNPSRLVTAGDFERAATTDFNEFQERFNVAVGRPADQDLVRRAAALMNRKPPHLDVPAAGNVSLLVLPRYDEAKFDDKVQATATSFADKVLLATFSPGLKNRLLAFLEPRRLITTRLHLVPPSLKTVSATVVVVVDSQRNTTQMELAVDAALRAFLSITRGADDGRGWPLGRRVRLSQLFRVLEDVPGVDHVESLALAPANSQGDVELGPLELPVWDSLVVQVKRA
jgi:hypothetical protein